LGWRILLERDPCANINKIINEAISKGIDIYELISSKGYIDKHQNISSIISKIISNDKLDAEEQKKIENELGLSLEKLILKLINGNEEESGLQEQSQQIHSDKPRILCTSFEGSKGLAAQFIFIVGVNEKHFPQKTPPSNRDIYRLIVALTRTRKRCYMISCNIFAGVKLSPSIFKSWLQDELSDEIFVDKTFINKHCN
jgi:superfamily I DNA/RNA helicase